MEISQKKTIILSVLLMGATAIVSQIIFLREFLVAFYGNEISVGVILASWLVWGSFGSWFLGRFSDRVRHKILLFSACQIYLALILPASLLAIRSAKSLMSISIGEIVGIYPIALVSFTILGFSCAVMGFMFSLMCRIFRSSSDIPAKGVSRVYVLEAVGALAGGMLVSYFLIRYMTAYSVILGLSALNLLLAVFLQGAADDFKGRKIFRGASLAVLLVFLSVILTGGGDALRKFSLQKLWEGYDVLASKDSVYGNITVTKKGDQVSFYDNGLNLYTVPDPASAEEAVHYAMLECANPKEVLLVGGGVGGLLEEVLKYPVRRVDYVELDPMIISLAKEYLKAEDASIFTSPKVNIINEDGRFYVKNTQEKYDCVIIHLGDPFTAQLNRFYTVEFFRELSRVLNEGGVVSFGLTSSINYLSGELKEYLRSIYLTASEVFPDVFIVPGDTAYFLLSNTEGTLKVDEGTLSGRLEERGIDTLYVRDYYLFDKLSAERVEYLKKNVEENIDVRINRDFRPISYYYATVFWSTQFDMPLFRKFLRVMTAENIWMAAALFCAVIALIILSNRKRRKRRAVMAAIMTTGFAEINFQIAVILSFQVIYGYVFYKLGVIITSFMAGLALGAWYIGKRMGSLRDDMRFFRLTQVSICIYPLILPVVFLIFSRGSSPRLAWIGSNIVFPFLPIIAGTIGGLQFPLANKIYLEEKERAGRVAGLSYGLDLLGACLGSFLAAAFLIPILGIFQTCLLVAVINLVVLALLTKK